MAAFAVIKPRFCSFREDSAGYTVYLFNIQERKINILGAVELQEEAHIGWNSESGSITPNVVVSKFQGLGDAVFLGMGKHRFHALGLIGRGLSWAVLFGFEGKFTLFWGNKS